MRESEYLRLKAQIEKDCQQKLQALETVWQLASTNGHKPVTSRKRRRRNGGLNSAITPLLPELKQQDTFSQPQVFTMLQEKQPELAATITPAAVSSALRRMEEDGLISLVVQGAGQRASTYRVK
ncbi:MAG TPA: hypothetical protein VGQ72_02450 [Pyrinomonadaceae bacterium]|nr:hypothetical protein [Pyrinomonadaceae bacterium]